MAGVRVILIGIDPGVETGIAVWDAQARCFVDVDSGTILRTMKAVEQHCRKIDAEFELRKAAFVIFEDARKRKWFGKMDREQGTYGSGVREGVGSVKRDCGIWEEFLTDLGVPFEARHPLSTKYDAERFRALTGWKDRTNEHSRDAGMIVFGMNESIARAKLVAWNDGQSAAKRQAGSRGSARPTV